MGHVTKWLFFNLLFGAIPYTLVAALNQLQSPGSALLHPSSEVLFIAVVATSSALGELWDGDDEPCRLYARSRGRSLAQLVLLVGVMSSSLLYGAYVYHTLMSPGRMHAIDCSAPGLIGGAEGALVAFARPICGTWARVQAGFFRWSVWVTGFWVMVSTLAMFFFRSKRRWPHGMV